MPNRQRRNKNSPSVDSESPPKKGPILISELVTPTVAAKQSKNTREPCQCEAKQHKLINNCLNCGRIVCAAEGSGSCFTCDALVCTAEERRILSGDTRESRVLSKQLIGEEGLSFKVVRNILCENTLSLQKAVEHRDKLLEYDKTVQRRTKVLDDEGDYYCDPDSNKWLTSKQREVLSKKQEEEREIRYGRSSGTNLTFDFAGRQVVEEKKTLPVYDVEELLADDTSIFLCPEADLTDFRGYRPEYCSDAEKKHTIRQSEITTGKAKALRIQDTDLQCMVDEGMCLSVRQPYASLLISGIKKHEGRSWYTHFRGRLWIHAAAKVPPPHEIKQIELFYTKKGDVNFPKSYPTGCLLGYVELVDCLNQEEYREKFPDGEIGSLFVFLCENPEELRIKLPMKGRHKIFKIDYKMHEAAKKTFRRIK